MPIFISSKKFRYLFSFTLLIGLFTTACQQEEPPAPEVETVPITEGRVKIEVTQDGLYTVSLADLHNLGANLNQLTSQQLKLTDQETIVPYFIQEDQLFFYGRSSDDIYTNIRPYILHIGEHNEDLADIEINTVAVSNNVNTPLTSVWRPLPIEQNQVYVSNARTSQQPDTWYWHTIHVEQTFTTEIELQNVTSEAAELTLWLWGASLDPQVENDHDFDLVINERHQGTIRWDGQIHYTTTLTLPAGTLQSGTNTFLLDNSVPGATFVDIMQFDRFHLTYPATPEAVNDRLDFVNTAGTVQLTGFSAIPHIFDITNPTAPQLLTGWSNSGNAAELTTTTEQHILAVGPNGYLTPERLTGLHSSTLTDTTNQADLIIVTSDTLAPALEPLIAAREAQGLTVSLAPVSEIYDTFGHGRATPDSINQFLRYAHTEWQDPAPRYLLLVGDGTYDNRNYLGQRPQNNIPAYIVPVTHSGETVSDARLADIDDDLRPNMAVGRWPVDTIADVESLVERTLAYEQGQVRDQALFTADGTSTEFTGLSDFLINTSILPNEQAVKLYGSTFEEVSTAWNDGAWLVTYVGHGSLNLWGKDSVFNIDAVSSLESSDSAPPIVLQFTCLTGFYAHPTQQSISEAMLTNPNGPVLLVAATSLTLSSHQRPFALATIDNLHNPEYERIGDALWQAKQTLDVTNAGLREISDTFGLIGDPSALIVRPALEAEDNAS